MKKIEKIFRRTKSSSSIHEAVLFVESTNGDFAVNYGHGGRGIDSPMLMASITKLFTTACILKLCDQGEISLDDKIGKHLEAGTMAGLHVFRGRDYSCDLTIANLLFHTSGLPCYFTDKNSHLNKERVIKEDVEFTYDEVIAIAKKLGPKFAPTGKRAFYSDVNFDSLGQILEKVTGFSIDKLFGKFVFEPLGMKNTYLPADADAFVPHAFYKQAKIHRPKYVKSNGSSGGCVSTPRDLMIFSKAFWGGKLFDGDAFKQLAVYRKVFGPLYYGGGYIRIKTGGYLTAFMGKGDLIGHSGSTGSFLYYYPHKDLHFAGDLTQITATSKVVRLLLKLVIYSRPA